MNRLLSIVAVLSAAATPVLAQSYDKVSPDRAAAIHECSARAAKYTEYTWGNMEFQQYRACMAERGQVE